MNTATAKTQDPIDASLDQLIQSARRVGYTEAVSNMTHLMMEVARLDDKDAILKAMAKGMDKINAKGPTHA